MVLCPCILSAGPLAQYGIQAGGCSGLMSSLNHLHVGHLRDDNVVTQPGTRIQVFGSGSRRMAGGTTMLTRPSIRCAQRMAIGGRCWHVPVSRLGVRLLMLQTFVYSAVTYGAEVWDCTQLMRERMSVVVKKGVRAILGPPMDCSCDALYGARTNWPLARSSMRRKFAGMTNVSTPPRRWIKCALDSYTGRRWQAPKVGTDWTQSLQKAVHGYRSR
jgi:hypothetical protein